MRSFGILVGLVIVVGLASLTFSSALSTQNRQGILAEDQLEWATIVDDLRNELDRESFDDNMMEVEEYMTTSPHTATAAHAPKAPAHPAAKATAAKPAPKAEKKTAVRHMTPAQFRKMLNAKAPRKRSGGKGLQPKKKAAGGAAKAAASKATSAKHRFVQVEAEQSPATGAGGVAGASGTKAGASGTKAGASGTKAGDAGGAAAASGTKAGASGTKAGNAGGDAAASGTKAGASGTKAGIVVAPTSQGPALAAGTGLTLDAVVAKFGAAGSALNTLFKKDGQLALQGTTQVEMQQQGACGSCWAQAAIGSLEVMLKQTRKYKEPLSVQQAIDCVRSSEANAGGCEGGTPMDVLDYFKTHPIATAAEYPLNPAGQGTCQDVQPKVKQFSAGFTLVAPSCMSGACTGQWQYELQVLQQLQASGAISLITYVDASNWQNYSKGLFPTNQCSSGADAGNHVVEIVGWGMSGKSPYWKIRNSWGNQWGIGGYIWLPFGSNACGLMNYVGHATTA